MTALFTLGGSVVPDRFQNSRRCGIGHQHTKFSIRIEIPRGTPRVLNLLDPSYCSGYRSANGSYLSRFFTIDSSAAQLSNERIIGHRVREHLEIFTLPSMAVNFL